MTVVDTERLVLRPWTPDDLEAVVELFADPDVSRFPWGRGLTREESQTFLDRNLEHWAEFGWGSWAAELRGEPGLVGSIGLRTVFWLPEVMPAVEVGWRLHPAHWGRGLATEGGRAALRCAFDTVGLECVIGIYVAENVASGRVMEKLGMRPWATATDPTYGSALEVRATTATQWRSGCSDGRMRP